MAVEQQQRQPAYLQPYTRAVKRHGAEFGALLWASPRTQRQRFEAIVGLVDPTGLIVLDLGCGRADLLDFFLNSGVRPQRYIGIEAVEELANAAARKDHENARIIRGDFLQDPRRIEIGADVILCSGSLNTLEPDDFYQVLLHAFTAARRVVVFNFLSSPLLAGAPFLRWHHLSDVMRFARTLTPKVTMRDDYIPGDCTMALWKEQADR